MPTAVPLTQLVDLALGTPEVGAVNFNVLHTLLHAMLNKLGIEEVKAEINDNERDYFENVLKQQTIQVDKDDSILKEPTDGPGPNLRVGSAVTDKDSAKGDDSILSDVTMSEPYIPRKTHYYHKLEGRVQELAKALAELNNLPTTNDLMADLKGKPSDSNKAAVADMWQNMQLKKRVDANEEGVSKLMQMVQDLMMELEEQREANKKLQAQMMEAMKFDGDLVMKQLAALQKETNSLRNDLDNGLKELRNLIDLFSLLPTQEEFNTFVRWGDLEDALKGIRIELEKLNQPMERVVNVVEVQLQTDKMESRPVSAASRQSRPGSSKSGPSDDLLDILETLGNIGTSHRDLCNRVDVLEEQMKNKVDKEDLANLGSTSELLDELKKLQGDIKVLEDAIAKLQNMSGVDAELRQQMDDLIKRIQEDAEALKRLQKMLALMEQSVDTLKVTTNDLTEDGKVKSDKIKELFDLCNGLERRKADKEYVAMEVDVKADKKQLEGKVNHHLFDTTTAEMNRNIRNILDRLSNSGDDDWKELLAKLTNDLDGKLDRMELNPLKDWLEKKLKALQKKIEAGSLQWSDDEAAGLKRQLIQHYNCLSCDKPINLIPGLHATNSAPAANYGLPANRSPRPYTTYELDQIRQHAKRIYSGANKPQRFGSPDQADFYATTRQCGGSHTVTMPHQRFSKFNAFNQIYREDEPEEIIAPVQREEVDVMGADGHIYRGRMERLEAKLPTKMMRQQTQPAMVNRAGNNNQNASPRPSSARHQPRIPEMRPPSSQGSRPQSARIPHRADPESRSGATTPHAEAMDQIVESPAVQVAGEPVTVSGE